MEQFIKSFTDWLPPLVLLVTTPYEKLALLSVAVLFGFWLYYKILKPGVVLVWAIVVGLVCAVSLHSLTIYAAYKFKRLNKIRWLNLLPFLFSRWLDFTFCGYKGTTITSQFYIWRGPFNWTLIAQRFANEPTLKEKAAYKRTDKYAEMDDDDDDEFDENEPSSAQNNSKRK